MCSCLFTLHCISIVAVTDAVTCQLSQVNGAQQLSPATQSTPVTCSSYAAKPSLAPRDHKAILRLARIFSNTTTASPPPTHHDDNNDCAYISTHAHTTPPHTMETYSLLVVLLLASLGFLAFAAKVALVTEIAFLLVVAYLAVFVALAALLAVAVCRVVSLYDKIAQGERHLNSCQTDASAKQQSAASRIDALERDIAEKKEAFAKVWHDRNSRSQEISALKKTHSQEIARLQAILVKVKSESVDSSEVEIAKRIERQWSLLRHSTLR